MFVRVKNGKRYLVRNYRQDGKVRQQVLCYLGDHESVEEAWARFQVQEEGSARLDAMFGHPKDWYEKKLRAEIERQEGYVKHGSTRAVKRLSTARQDLERYLAREARRARRREQLRTLLAVVPESPSRGRDMGTTEDVVPNGQGQRSPDMGTTPVDLTCPYCGDTAEKDRAGGWRCPTCPCIPEGPPPWRRIGESLADFYHRIDEVTP